MLDNFDRKVMQDKELLQKYGNNLTQKVIDNIIIASVVEKEIASPERREIDEAEKVAGVLKKRYEENWQI
jgi:cell division protein YceG involved in septum cleavage